MKLEEIVGYLSYGLKVEVRGLNARKSVQEIIGYTKEPEDEYFLDGIGWIVVSEEEKATGEKYLGMPVGSHQIKPILKTELSEEELLELSQIAYPENKFGSITEGEYILGENCVMRLRQWQRTIQYLYSIHYDIHGLVERGEAIDMKTI